MSASTRFQRLRQDRGASMVEFALILPLLVLLIFGLVEFGIGYNAQITLTHAAREGVRTLAVTKDSAEAVTATKNAATSLQPSPGFGEHHRLQPGQRHECDRHLPIHIRHSPIWYEHDHPHRKRSHAMRRLKQLSRRLSDERGATAVIVAISLTALIGMAAFAIDVGALYGERRELQSGADAGALAVAEDCALGKPCTTGTANTTAGTYASSNANDGAAGIESVDLNTAAKEVTVQPKHWTPVDQTYTSPFSPR